jgi:hypothetical protein
MTDLLFPYPVATGAGRNAFAVPRRRPPHTVRLAGALMLTRAALAVAGLVSFSLATGSLRGRLSDQFPALSASQLNLAIDIGLTVALVIGAAWVLGYSYLVARVRRGGNLARVLAIAWSWLAIAGTFYLASTTHSSTVGLLALADLVLNVGIIVLLTVAESWDYSNRYRMA